MPDILINFGGGIKAQLDGSLSGYLVRFSSEDDPDLVGDFFTKSTDFGIEEGSKTPIYLHHRQPLETKSGARVVVKKKIGEGTLKMDDEGILIEAILYEREKYEKALASMGWSSGTAAHLIDREKRGKAFEIKHWPLGHDASLTPRPCEPRNVAYLKSIGGIELEELDLDLPAIDETKGAVGGWTTEGDYIHYRIKDPADFEDKSFRTITIKKDKPVIKAVIGKLKGESSTTLQNLMFLTSDWTMAEAKKWVKDHPDTKKSFDTKAIDGQALFNDSLRQREQQTWDLWSAVQTGVRKITDAARSTDVTGVEVNITEAVSALIGAYSPKLITAIVTQIEDYLNSDYSEPFYLKSTVLDEFIASGEELVSDSTLEDHSARVVSAVAEFTQQGEAISQPLKAWLMRLKDKQEFRAHDPLKTGRVISQTNKDKMGTVHEQMSNLMMVLKEMQTSLTELMAMAEPKKSVDLDTARGLVASFEMLKMKRTLTAGR